MVNRNIAPAVHDPVEFDFVLPAVNEEQLDNGLPFYWLDAGVQEVAEVDWVFPAGLWYETRASLAQATGALLKSGTSRMTSAEINEALEFYGAQLKINAGNDYTVISLYAMTRHLPDLLPIVYDIITAADFPEHEVEIHKQNAIQKLLVNLRQCDFVANREIDAMLYGADHPYGRYSVRENIEGLNRADLLAFHRKAYDLTHARMFMAGRVGTKEAAEVNRVFGRHALSGATLVTSAYTALTSAERSSRMTNDANGVQAALRVGRQFPNRHHPDYSAFIVLNTLFGGYFGSRLMSNIREEKGYTYGIYSSLNPEVNGGSLVIQSEVGRDVAELAVQEIYKEMELLCAEPASKDELLLVKNYLLGGLLGDLDGPFSIIRRWRTLVLNGFREDYFYNNVRIYKTVTAEELQQLAQKYFSKGDFTELVVV